MIQEERYKILETGVHAAEIMASSYSGIKYGNFCIYLYRQLRSYRINYGYIYSMRVYRY